MVMRSFFCSILLLAGCLSAADFWQAYHSEVTALAPGEVQAVTGQRLGGVMRRHQLPEQGVRYEVTCQVRGSGMAQLGVNGSSGWAYSNESQLDTNAWKTFSVLYYETAPAFTISMYTLENQGATFQVKNAIVKAVPLPKGSAMPVTIAFEAEDVPGSNCQIAESDGAYGGRATRGGRHYQLSLLPVPFTTMPLYAYCRVRLDAGRATIKLNCGAARQVLAGKSVTLTADWQWVQVGPMLAAGMFPEMICRFTSDNNSDLVWLDRIVISTEANLTAPETIIPRQQYPLGLATAAQTKTPPTIDGLDNDECWRQTVELGPFILCKENQPAYEQTSVRLSWDDENLYVFFRCWESCLVPAANRRHEFKTKVEKHDQETIWGDDCVLLIMQPDPKQNVCYDIAVTAKGMVNDAKMTGINIWSTRDVNWNTNAKVATVVEDGYWNVEMAIPLATMQAQKQKNWRFRAGRIEKSRSENSSWNLVDGGFHDLEELADLHLLEKSIGCSNIVLPTFGPGNNEISFQSETPLQYEIKVQHEKVREKITRGLSAEKAEFQVTQSGRFEFQWRLSTPDLMTCLLASPQLKLSASSRLLEFAIKGGEVTLNGRLAKSGDALNLGANRLEIKADGEVSGSFQCGDFVLPVDDSWKHEDGVWKRVLLVDDSRVWPEWRLEGVSIARGSIQQFIMIPHGVEGYELKDYKFYFDLPVGFEMLGASGYYKVWELKTAVTGSVTYKGKPYVRHEVQFLKTVPNNRNRPSWQNAAALVKVPEDFPEGKTEIFFHAGSQAAGISEIPQSIPVDILPPLQGTPPEQPLLLQMWAGWIHAMTDKSFYDIYATQLRQMGVNETNFGDGKIVDRLALITLEYWCLNPTDFLKQHPDFRLVNFAGKASDTAVCGTVMISDQEWLTVLQDQLIPGFLERYGHPRHVDWDYEAPVLTSLLACFCPRCLTKFREAFPEVPAEVTAEQIKQTYFDQWVKFMNQRMATVAGIFRDGLRRHQPGIVFSVYSGYHSDFTKYHYGVDWALLRDKIDRTMCGYGRPVDNIEATREAIGDMPFTLGLIANPYEVEKRMPPTWFRPTDLMRRVCDGTGGVLLYNYPTLDSRSFHSIAKISRAMTQYAEYFVKRDVSRRTAVTTPGWNDAEREVLAGKDESLLVVLMNSRREPKSYQISLPEGYVAKEQLNGEVQPGEYVTILAKKR